MDNISPVTRSRKTNNRFSCSFNCLIEKYLFLAIFPERVPLEISFFDAFLATFFTGAFFTGVFLATFFTGAFFTGAFLATFFTGAVFFAPVFLIFCLQI